MTDETLFAAALDKADPAERAAFLDAACPDPAARERVDRLLAAHDRAGAFMNRPAVAPEGFPTMTQTSDGGGTAEPDDALGVLAPSTRPDSLGRIGHYEVLQVLGKGAFGIVFRAFDDVLQRVVAVKVMAPQLAATSPARKRFLREARAAAAVRHENVVQVYEVAEQPLPFIAMEFIPGETLQQRLNRVGPVDPAEVVGVGRQIAEGLAAAHASDLIHRDIKPGNVLIEGGQGRVKITDFGLARAADDASISQSGIIAGTPMYMAPEQALGQKLDQRADLFSLGSVLYQMAAGRPPFRAAGTVAVLKRVAEDTPRAIREITPETPQWLCDIISKLHAKNPALRYQTAREVADVLADCERQLKTNSKLKDYSRIPRAAAPAKRRRWAAVLGLAALVVGGAVAAAAGLYLAAGGPRPGADPGPGTAPPAPAADGFVALFNGKDLTGWKTHPEQPGGWEVRDGVLVGSGRQSHLFSERADYADFHLRAEMKVNAGGDSGIRFRVPFALQRGKQPWQVLPAGGYEVEFNEYPGTAVRTGSVWRVNPPGPPVALVRREGESLSRPDAWAVVEVVATGNRIVVKVDGREAADCVDRESLHTRGHVALQVFVPATTVQFRKVEIKELPRASASPPPPPAVAPFDTAAAKAHQDAWAKHLGVPVELTNSIGMKFRLIPPGEFMMGASEEDIERRLAGLPNWHADRIKAEGPQQRMTVREPYYLGQFEVTVGQFRQFVQETGHKTTAETNGVGGERFTPDGKKEFDPAYLWSNRIDSETDDHPVVQVGYDDARQFCTWLGKKDGRTYSLPRDDQWEFACRAGTTTPWFTGKKENVQDFAWVKENANGRLQPVGLKAPNPFGLHDVLGNVMEICEPVPPKKVAGRGGSSISMGRFNESASRWEFVEGQVGFRAGFRVAIVGDLSAPAPSPIAQSVPPPPPAFTNGVGMEFVRVPKGRAWLGGGKDRPGDKEVDIPADFYLGKYEVTQEQWQTVMGENPSHFSRTGGGADAVKDIPDADLKRFPVENVSWDQCQEFVAKLNTLEKETGWVYRLPTGMEWEYACRGGPMADKADSAFDFYVANPTNNLPLGQANINPGTKENPLGLRRTCRVGGYEANRLGLFDMHGNVWEWCENTMAIGSPFREYRSGGWNTQAESCQTSYRVGKLPSTRFGTLGLRLARVPSGAPSPEVKTPPVAPAWTVLKPAEMTSEGGATLKLQADDAVLASGTLADKDTYTLTIRDLPAKVHSLRLEVLPHASLPKNGPGRHPNLSFVLSTIKAELVPPGKADAKALKLAHAWADHSTGDDATPVLAIDADDNTGWCAEFDVWHFLVVELAEPVTVPAGTTLRVTLEFRHQDAQRTLGCFRLSAAPVAPPRPKE